MYKFLKVSALATICLITACTTTDKHELKPSIPSTFTTMASDKVVIHGYNYMGNLSKNAPLILLFHQGGSNARAEYEPIAKWLNEEGFRAVAWDQRSGGNNYYGGVNQTVSGLATGKSAGYCEASPDLQAALNYVTEKGWGDEVIVWGSSYSAALVFELAKNNPNKISKLIAFSPPSGGPLKDCRARMWVDDIKIPMLVMRPASEMKSDNSKEQRRIFEEAQVDFMVIENGIHGSSMLVDERTEEDMSEARRKVASWLRENSNK